MKPILVIYATREGHTARIADHMADLLRSEGHPAEVIDAAHVPENFQVGDYASAVVAASLHMGKFEREIRMFVKDYVGDLQKIPSMFVSVSNAERAAEDPETTPESRAEAQAYVRRTVNQFLAESGWLPSHVTAAAGALPYSKFGFITRFMMKRIAKSTGAPTDTSHDYVFTDWEKLDHEVEEFETVV